MTREGNWKESLEGDRAWGINTRPFLFTAKKRYVSLPRVTPTPLARFDVPFEHPDWIFEPKNGRFSSCRLCRGRHLPIGIAQLECV